MLVTEYAAARVHLIQQAALRTTGRTIRNELVSAYKYMTSEGGIRFLRSWCLRITPPADFNDPFELRPQIQQVFTEEYLDVQFQAAVPQMAITELTEQLTPTLGAILTQEEITDMVTYMVTPPDANTHSRVLENLERKIPRFSRATFAQLQQQVKSQWPTLMQQARELAATHLPRINSIVKHELTEELSAKLGVLCFSRNANQPLMWAHYADSHKGLMFEFDTAHPTFNRKRSADDDFGCLRPVSYSKVRPEMTMPSLDGDNAFEIFALTKADQWSYEEEIRLIWPLKFSDKTVDTPLGPIGLLSCPSSAVLSVTLGCKASERTLNEVRQALRSQPDTAHITVRKAQLDETAFELNYYDI